MAVDPREALAKIRQLEDDVYENMVVGLELISEGFSELEKVFGDLTVIYDILYEVIDQESDFGYFCRELVDYLYDLEEKYEEMV